MFARLRQLIVEIHRRSLWQVLVVYLGASWGVLEAIDHVVDRYLLPGWVSGAAVVLLLLGFPIVLATAMVRESSTEATAETGVRDPTLLAPREGVPEGSAGGWGSPVPESIARFLTWPKAVLAGLLAFAGLAAVSAFIVLRGVPRVAQASGMAGAAFEERAWIVMAEFEAPPEEAEIGAAAGTALRVDLEQSAYLNVYSREQVAPVLRRMGLPDTISVDRARALEIAEREGLAAVLVPEVSRLGSAYVFAARVIQAGSRRQLISVKATASEDRLLEGVERLSRELRGRLGEAKDAIERSRPLPRVTTPSLEALEKYAMAVESDDPWDRIELASEALQLDTAFAMAERLLAANYFFVGRLDDALDHARRAYELRDRLTERERLHVEAVYWEQSFEPRKAADVYERLLQQYPDDWMAAADLGWIRRGFLGQHERSYGLFLRAVDLAPYSGPYFLLTVSAIETGRWDVVDSLLALPELPSDSRQTLIRLGHHFGLGNLDRADQLCDSLFRADLDPPPAGTLTLSEQLWSGLFRASACGSIDVARGRVRRGLERIEGDLRRLLAQQHSRFLHNQVAAFAAAEQLYGSEEATAVIRDVLDGMPPGVLGEGDAYYLRTRLQLVSGVLGRLDWLAAVDSAYGSVAYPSEWAERYGENLGAAARALAAGDHGRALKHVRAAEETGYEQSHFFVEQQLLRGLSHEGLGQVDSAIAYLEGAIAPGQTAQWWKFSGIVQLPSVLFRLAELEERRGDTEAAVRHYARILELWAEPDPELRDDVAAIRRAMARLTGAESG